MANPVENIGRRTETITGFHACGLGTKRNREDLLGMGRSGTRRHASVAPILVQEK
jgi:hypothetical protein